MLSTRRSFTLHSPLTWTQKQQRSWPTLKCHGGWSALSGTISEPAWKSKPSWYLVATDDKMIPPPAQRLMSQRAGAKVVEVAGSHAIYVSQPKAVAALIEQAAKALKVPAR